MRGSELVNLRELRKQKGLTQQKCADFLGIPLRTYQNYENDRLKSDSIKYQYMMNKLLEYGYVDEEHGVLSVDAIKKICSEIFANKNVEYCYLFGSYAKGKASEKSDVDLLISADISGIAFYDLVETLREELKKKVDVLNLEQLDNNKDLVKEILKDGIKIYG